MTVVDDFWNWFDKVFGKRGDITNFVQTVKAMQKPEMIESYWKEQTESTRADPGAIAAYKAAKQHADENWDERDALEKFIANSLDDWMETIQKYETSDPEKAKANLVKLSSDVMKIAAASATVDLALGAIPTLSAGPASSANTKQLLAWLGVGAVITAVAHDPVKIGLLRPYQDSLEQTFRNRRPDDFSLFQAYKTRELSPVKIEDLSKLDDKEMDRIEADNDAVYFKEISKWGYSEWFATALSRSATQTLNFSQLTALARQGLLTRGMAIYSLWGQGLDRVVMKPALDALMVQNRISNYEGFRAQIEPAYIEGIVSESELVDYWNKINVPGDVQAAMLPRFRKKRDAYLTKQTQGAPAKERDLTVSQIQQGYQNQLMDRAHAQNAMLTLGYSLDEVKILLDLAEMRRKLPSAQTLKRLTLTDYEKAHKNGLIPLEAVLDRMKGEYAPEDIELERQLLKIGKA